MCLDGDDWLAHSEVLTILSKIYEHPQIWLTYGNWESYPKGTPTLCERLPPDVLQKKSFRQYSWVTSHLKTFYAALFHKIKKSDLTKDGEFLPMSGDLAMMFPMLEMASKNHIYYIDEVLYRYNVKNPLRDGLIDPELQTTINWWIREKPPYAPLDSLF